MLVPGTTLEERYVIEPLLGKGGFGAVYAARELPPLRRIVAVKQTLFPVEPLLDALDYLHTLNPPLIHRDIKPQNVRITPKHKVFLVDFGIAKLSDPDIRTATLARAVTSGFSPFEQYGDGPTDARSDLYSLGATPYYMLKRRCAQEGAAQTAPERSI